MTITVVSVKTDNQEGVKAMIPSCGKKKVDIVDDSKVSYDTIQSTVPGSD